jgi:hypothetical protein
MEVQVGRPQGPGLFHHVWLVDFRCVKGRCGTSLRFVSSLGLGPPLDAPRRPAIVKPNANLLVSLSS